MTSLPSAAELIGAVRFHLRPLRSLGSGRTSAGGLTWPVTLGPVDVAGHPAIMRSPHRWDGGRWRELRLRDRARIEPWWSTSALSWAERHTPEAWVSRHLAARRAARAGRAVPMVLDLGGGLSGECNLEWIDQATGAAEVGAWIAADVPRGPLPAVCLAMVLDHAFGPLGLHRVSAPICVDNRAAAVVALRVGLRREAVMSGYLDVGGARADHVLYAVTADRRPPGGFVSALIDGRGTGPATRNERCERLDIAVGDRHARRSEAPRAAVSRVVATSRPTVVELLAALRFHLRPLRGRARRTSPSAGLTWQVTLGPELVDGHRLVVRSPRRSDGERWRTLRLRDRARIEPWWATSQLSWEQRHTAGAWISNLLADRRAARAGRSAPMVVELDGALVGECRLEWIDHALQASEVGIWMAADLPAAPLAELVVAMVLDHAFGALGLRRVSAPVSEGNRPAARLMLRLGMRREGVMSGYLDVGGTRADHVLFAITADRVPDGGLVAAVRAGRPDNPAV